MEGCIAPWKLPSAWRSFHRRAERSNALENLGFQQGSLRCDKEPCNAVENVTLRAQSPIRLGLSFVYPFSDAHWLGGAQVRPESAPSVPKGSDNQLALVVGVVEVGHQPLEIEAANAGYRGGRIERTDSWYGRQQLDRSVQILKKDLRAA